MACDPDLIMFLKTLDNTNRDAQTRSTYVDLAREAGARVRCFVFTANMGISWHANLYRAFFAPLPVSGCSKSNGAHAEFDRLKYCFRNAAT
jgi:hypothetical protein